LLNLDDSFISDLSSEDCEEMFAYESPTFKELDETEKLEKINLQSTNEKNATKIQRELISQNFEKVEAHWST